MEPISIPGHPRIRIRDLAETDISHIARYWATASPEHLLRMGVDPKRLPTAEQVTEGLKAGLSIPDSAKSACVLVWDLDAQPVGFTTLKRIRPGQDGDAHLHMWKETERGKGHGTLFFSHSLLAFFDRFSLQRIVCEPAAQNPAPNGLLRRLGIPLVRTYRTVPSELCFEVEVNRYETDRARIEAICRRLTES